MSARLIFWVLVLVVGCVWMFNRPVVGVCLNIALFPLTPGQWGAGLEAIRWQFIATACLAAAYLVHLRSFRKPTVKEAAPFCFLVAYLIWSLIVCTWAVHSKDVAIAETWQFAKLVFFVFLLIQIVSTEEDLRIVAWTIFVSMTLKAFLDRWGTVWEIGILETDLICGFLGTWLAFMLPALGLVILAAKKWPERILGLALMPFILDYFAFRAQRSAFLSLAVSAVGVLVLAPRRYRLKVAAGVAAGVVAFVGWLTPASFWERMATIADPKSEASAASRFTINEASWKMIADYPWGVAPGNYQYVSVRYLPPTILCKATGTRAAHNTFLVVLGERGWVGFAVWLAVMGLTCYSFLRVSLDRRQVGGLPVVLARGFLIGLVSIFPALYTHQEDRTDALYWIVGLSIVVAKWYDSQPHDVVSPKQARVS
jgi:hypothetical protein